jgi:hypothetical protein
VGARCELQDFFYNYAKIQFGVFERNGADIILESTMREVLGKKFVKPGFLVVFEGPNYAEVRGPSTVDVRIHTDGVVAGAWLHDPKTGLALAIPKALDLPVRKDDFIELNSISVRVNKYADWSRRFV